MGNVQSVVLMRYGYQDDNARRETWNPHSDTTLVLSSPEELKTKLDQWNQEIISCRIKDLSILNAQATLSIERCDAREAAVLKLTDEEKKVLEIRNEDFNSQRSRFKQEIAKNEEIIGKLTVMSAHEIMNAGLVVHWWVFEEAEIKSLQEFEREFCNADEVDEN